MRISLMAPMTLSLIATTAVLCSGRTAAADDNRSIDVGQKIILYRFWNCGQNADDVQVTQQPTHGKLELEAFQFSGGRANSGCVATSVAGTRVWYTPDTGFIGTDTFGLTHWYGNKSNSRRSDTRNVTVKVNNFPNEWRHNVHAEEEAEIGTHWDCEGPVPEIEILDPPKHGKLEVRQVTDVAPDRAPADCRVNHVPGIEFHYTPAAGFTGKDQFVYKAWRRSDLDKERTYQKARRIIEVE